MLTVTAFLLAATTVAAEQPGTLTQFPITPGGSEAFLRDVTAGIGSGPHGKDVYFGAVRANVIGQIKVEGDCGARKCP